ncbi:hypothetical protein Trydic_g7633 [Trypoxylus dichotomus]
MIRREVESIEENMDQEKLDLFSLLLRSTYEETVHIDVLKVLNDPYADEYNMKQVEFDMIVFSSAVMSITVKHYDRAKQIMTGLIMKYRNPIFYYILGVSHFYDLSFKEAQQQFDTVMQLLSENRNTKFPWPDTDIMIITIAADKIREYATIFMNTITAIKEIKKIKTLKCTERIETISISSTSVSSSINFNVRIGHVVQYDIYPYIQAVLGDLIKFDKSKLPVEYHKILLQKPKMITNESPKQPAPVQKKTSVSTTTNTNKKNERVPSEVTQKKTAPPEISTSEKTKKYQNQTVQVTPSAKSKQVQTVLKNAHQFTQTSEDLTSISDKHKYDQEITNLRSKLHQMTVKLKEAEAKLNKNKENVEINEKNKLIAEQQEIISNLKLKLNQSNSKHKDYERLLRNSNGKISELSRTNKAILAESEKHKETITGLRNYNQILERSANNVGKKEEDLLSIQKNLFEKYRSMCFVQIQFYESFHKRCQKVLNVLEGIIGYLTEITVPTKAECEKAISEWFYTMVSCIDILQTNKKLYNKYDKYVSQDSLIELSNILPMMAIHEPYDILLENTPILIYTIADFEKMLQNNHNKTVKDKHKDNKKEIDAKNDFSGKTDYRKKCNFIHKPVPPFSVNDSSSAACVKPSKSGIVAEHENANQCKSIETNSKKYRSLLTYLKQNIPYRTEGDIVNALNIYRQNNNGSLSGMAVQFILYNVLKILETPETAWSAVKAELEDLDDDKDVCPICIEVIRDEPKSILTCRHVYHTECIREWLAVNRVCAVCRQYTVLDEDFPPLKN